MGSPLQPKRKRARAPWAAQKMPQRRAIVRKHTIPIVSQKVLRILGLRKNKIDGVPLSEKYALLKEYASDMGQIMSGLDSKLKPAMVRELLRKDPSGISESTINALLRMWCQEQIDSARKETPNVVLKRLRSYLKDRSIPYDDSSAIAAVNLYIKGKSIESIAHGLNFAELEKNYIWMQKIDRGIKIDRATQLNEYTGLISRGEKFTPNQKLAIKRWLKTELPIYHKKRLEVFRSTNDLAKAFRDIGVLENQFLSSARKMFVERFAASPQPKFEIKKPVVQKQIGPAKIGSREERMASYVPRQKEAERRNSLAQKVEAAKEAGRPFDVAAYCLAEIAKESPPTASRLKSIIARGLINQDSIKRLYSSGSLSQRTFIASLDAGFEAQFGEKSVNSIARAISYIGSVGRIQTHVERMLQSPKSRQMLEFLSRAKLIELGHSGGDVVYLARSGTRN